MINRIFLNLPVADLQRSIDFFTALGFTYNPQFSDDSAACIVISDAISVMLGTHAKFREFTPKAVCDTSQAVEVLLSLSCESREQVDDLVARALVAGGSTYDKPEEINLYKDGIRLRMGKGRAVLFKFRSLESYDFIGLLVAKGLNPKLFGPGGDATQSLDFS